MIIDADAHVEESEAMFQCLEREFYPRRPLAVSLAPDTVFGKYNAVWLIDGETYPKLVGKGGIEKQPDGSFGVYMEEPERKAFPLPAAEGGDWPLGYLETADGKPKPRNVDTSDPSSARSSSAAPPAPPVPDVVAGQVHFMIDGPPPFLGHVKAGRLRALAAASDRRLEQLPDVPTFAEQGYQGMEAGLWYAMLAPRGTPQPVIRRLNTAINEALRQPDVRQRFAASSVEPVGGTPEACASYLAAEIKRWGEVARAAHIRIE